MGSKVTNFDCQSLTIFSPWILAQKCPNFAVWLDRMLPVGKSECKKLKAGRLKQQVPVLVGEVGYPGDAVAEVADHVDGGGEQVVELGDLHRFVFHQT